MIKASEVLHQEATDVINLQSLLNLAVESLHATTNIKQDFGKEMRESVKRITNWSAKYFTHQRSYYPVPEVAMDLRNVS